VLPEGLSADIDGGSWPVPPIFKEIQKRGRITDEEMFRTFNMGVGMVVILSSRSVSRTVSLFEDRGVKAWEIGRVVEGDTRVRILE